MESVLDTKCSAENLKLQKSSIVFLTVKKSIFCKTFRALDMSGRVVNHCKIVFVLCAGFNSFLLWFWCAEQEMPIFWFERIFPNSKQNDRE